MRNIFFLVAMLISTIVVFGQKKELQSITEPDLKAHLQFLSSDLLQGRDFGTTVPGIQIAAGYLKSQCVRLGLKPALPGYSQPVGMIRIQADSANTRFVLKNKTGEPVFETGKIVSFFSSAKNDTVNAELVFAGYGWQNKEKGYNDLEGIDLKGKIVMIMTRTPELANDTAASIQSANNVEMMKISGILMAGAKAIMFVPDPLNPDKRWFEMAKEFASSGSYQLEGKKTGFIPGMILLAGTETANAMLKETGKTIEQLQVEINSSMKPASVALQNVTATLVIAKKVKKIEGENIIGVIEGSDPVLKNECVVLTAHYDHVGLAPNGQVNNGADDNGSGTVALLELAEAMMKMDKKPKRSIVFAWVTAEEKGLFGSNYYVEHPVFPLEKTVANVNLDMVGRSAPKDPENMDDPDKSLAGPDRIYLIKGKTSTSLNKITDKYCKQLQLVPNSELTDVFLNRSDQVHFYKNNIPVLCISTGLHEDYHQVSDDEAKIDYKKMKRISDFTYLVTVEIANSKKRIEFDK